MNYMNKIVLIDGLNRSGKNALVGPVTSLKNSESIEMNYILEHIIQGVSLKLIKLDFAKSFFLKFFDEIFYNKFIARNANFRKIDSSSVLNFSFPKIYKSRLNKKDGIGIFSELKKTKNFFPFMTHEIMANLDILDKIKLDYKMIAVFRSPFDIVYSWHKKKIIKNFGKKNFTLSFFKKKKVYPWYVFNNYSQWLKLNNLEKSAFIINDLLTKSITQYKKSKIKKKILVISYEKYVENTNSELKKISKFLNTSFSIKTKGEIKKSKLPIKINLKEKNKRKNYLKIKLKPASFAKLNKLEERYKKNIYNLV